MPSINLRNIKKKLLGTPKIKPARTFYSNLWFVSAKKIVCNEFVSYEVSGLVQWKVCKERMPQNAIMSEYPWWQNCVIASIRRKNGHWKQFSIFRRLEFQIIFRPLKGLRANRSPDTSWMSKDLSRRRDFDPNATLTYRPEAVAQWSVRLPIYREVVGSFCVLFLERMQCKYLAVQHKMLIFGSLL